MRLTIIAPESIYDQEVDPSMVAAVPAPDQTLSTDAGVALSEDDKPLSSYGLNGESATLFLTFRDADFERMRLQALGDPRLMAQLRQANPEFASAIQAGGSRFKEIIRRQESTMRAAAEEKERQIELLNADPYDIEVSGSSVAGLTKQAQKKIEEAIRMEAVLENMQHAMEFSSFGHVTMLYINVEVNGHPVKAFVDSGAQTTITCGIMRLLDKRFSGVAQGVGTAKILGRIHSAQIKLGDMFLPVAFSVLEGQSVDLLFGLDMLKRHQACIDLSTNTLRIAKTEIPFLSEHELPEQARMRAPEAGPSSVAGSAPAQPTSSTHGSSAGASGSAPSGSSSGSPNSRDIETVRCRRFLCADFQLVGLGASPDQAAQLLAAAGGNVDMAASMLFS
ncbi:SNARE binding protein [Trichosporon asahii var. asahii CBS 8904]|uniref:SNARE binding protein n=1 Tax=Trichosporon asahii var. asahii (strain CBS 8904) TaxID=1220162 RepID=K1VJ91_TRIAC|nr:SNARE binding protein [Trichosporon asahii var. asahii CBS 8904]